MVKGNDAACPMLNDNLYDMILIYFDFDLGLGGPD